MAAQPPRVTRIVIKDLFRSHTIDVQMRLKDRVTILHGRNGSGKTVTLALVNAVLTGNLEALPQVPFDYLELQFSNEVRLRLSQLRVVADGTASPGRSPHDQSVTDLRFELWHSGDGAPRSMDVPLVGVSQGFKRWMSRRQALYPIPAGPNSWIDRAGGEILSGLGLFFRCFPEFIRSEEGFGDAWPVLSPVLFIETQRLLVAGGWISAGRSETRFQHAVAKISREVLDMVNRVDNEYRQLSTQLDDSLPTRMFAARTVARLPGGELSDRSAAVERERARLRMIGILADAPSPFDPNTLEEGQRHMFAVYLDDAERKLAIFRPLAGRLELLLELLNRKFSPKTISFNKRTGYRVLSHDGVELELERLSSGEQHELVLLHSLLFDAEPGTLLLIDEPELSLHVTWQREFLADLIRVAKVAEFDAILATHSPYIVGDRRDLLVQLGAPEEAEA